MLGKFYWHYFLIEFFIFLAIATLLGLLTRYFALSYAIAIGSLLFWQVYNQHKLSNWIWSSNALYPPTSLGSWNTIFYGIHKKQKHYRQRQNELAFTIKRFRSAIESSPDTLILIDFNGKILWCNKLAQYQLNIHWPNDKGQNILNLLRYPDLTTYMQKKDFSKPFTLFYKQKNYFEFRVIPYVNNQWIILVRDVDQLYLAEQQRQDFFTNASHELRTPITVVKSYLDMLSDGLIPPEKQLQTVTTMQKQIDRVEALVEQILSLSEIENSSAKLVMQTVNMPAILSEIAHQVTQLYPRNHFVFNVDINLQVEGNRDQLYGVVNNLIFNAIKHTPEATTITVDWQRKAQGAYFCVTDSGQGIAAHHLARLTERFYQVDSARSHEQNSSGLGLAIVKHSLLNHGSTKLEIESELGKGSRFFFTLPSRYIVALTKALLTKL